VLKESNPEYTALNDFSTELNLVQHITSPTRITDSSQTLLDVIFTPPTARVRNIGVLNVQISDHLPVYVELKLKSPKPQPCYITVRSYKNYSSELFTTDLACTSNRLLSIFAEDDVNTKLNIFNDILQCPYPFVTRKIKELMKNKEALHLRFLQSRDLTDWNNYKKCRNSVKDALKNAERNYTFDQVQQHKDNPGSLWKIINHAIPHLKKRSYKPTIKI
jgi:hypothetical protein